jgi:tetratricopeptide (TPR) repeat protein
MRGLTSKPVICLLGAGFLLTLLAAPALPGPGAPAPTIERSFAPQVRQADDYFLGRENLENVRTALGYLAGEVASNANDYEAWWRIAKFSNYLARHAQGKEELKLLDAAVDAGKKAVALQPNRVEGHFWLGASEGLLAEEGGLLKGLALVDTIRKEMVTVVRLDPDYEEAAGLRTLARVYYRAPFFKGGDKQRSIQLLEECLKRYPNNSLAMVYLAESDLAVGRRQEARELLEKVLSLCPDPIYGPELADNQAEAREVLTTNFHSGK